jgi:hypothetical protein
MTHTCYVEVWGSLAAYQRIFTRSASPVEVCNDHGAVAALFRALREQPQRLLAALNDPSSADDLAPMVALYQHLVTHWQACKARHLHPSRRRKRNCEPRCLPHTSG